jgi:hypothetical protein
MSSLELPKKAIATGLFKPVATVSMLRFGSDIAGGLSSANVNCETSAGGLTWPKTSGMFSNNDAMERNKTSANTSGGATLSLCNIVLYPVLR